MSGSPDVPFSLDGVWNRSAGQTPWQRAEELGAEWMRALGFVDAAVTRSVGDGGIDVVASNAVAQVKMHSQSVGRPDVQRLRGAAYTVEFAVFFSFSGYTTGAVAYADSNKVALFDVVHGEPQPYNQIANALVLAQNSALAEQEATVQAQLQEERLLSEKEQEVRRAVERQEQEAQRDARLQLAKRDAERKQRRQHRRAVARTWGRLVLQGLRRGWAWFVTAWPTTWRVMVAVTAPVFVVAPVSITTEALAGPWNEGEAPAWVGFILILVWVPAGVTLWLALRRSRPISPTSWDVPTTPDSSRPLPPPSPSS